MHDAHVPLLGALPGQVQVEQALPKSQVVIDVCPRLCLRNYRLLILVRPRACVSHAPPMPFPPNLSGLRKDCCLEKLAPAVVVLRPSPP
eukprot:7482702-Pyramimonas_sp.AAC.1